MATMAAPINNGRIGAPIAVIDEIEAGLEPYRQRALLAQLRVMLASDGQAFITTHSPAVLGRMRSGEAWRLSHEPEHSVLIVGGVIALNLAGAH